MPLHRQALLAAVAACGLLLSPPPSVFAEEPATRNRWLKLPVEYPERWQRESRRDVDPWRRAGYPQDVRRIAGASVDHAYTGGYVGGGAAVLGRGRSPGAEGVWGVDYTGRLLPRRVFLDWTRGWRSQGGSGQYETDGPHLKHTAERALHRLGEH